jgi:hypothetical protein
MFVGGRYRCGNGALRMRDPNTLGPGASGLRLLSSALSDRPLRLGCGVRLASSKLAPAGIDGVAHDAVGAKATFDRCPRVCRSIELLLVDRDVPNPRPESRGLTQARRTIDGGSPRWSQS